MVRNTEASLIRREIKRVTVDINRIKARRKADLKYIKFLEMRKRQLQVAEKDGAWPSGGVT